MFKVMLLVRRKPGLSKEDFIQIFEGRHVPLTASMIKEGIMPPMIDYRRNYLQRDDPANINLQIEFDVIVEAWFEDRDSFVASRKTLNNPEIRSVVMASLETFLDLKTMQYVVVDEQSGFGLQPIPARASITSTIR
jgi:EthD domain